MAWLFERQKALMVRRLGWTERAHSVIFGFWLVAGFHLSRQGPAQARVTASGGAIHTMKA